MCGIAGYTGRAVPGRLAAMSAGLRHRGPDGEGIYEGRGYHLCMRRLAIVDLETGDQPQWSADGSIAVFFNGEIYNHVELRARLVAQGCAFRSRSSDTEVIVQLYAREGMRFVQRLNGMFAICILDKRRDRMYLIRDRLGKKPLYYLREPRGGLWFASEFNVLSQLLPRAELPVDRSALLWYFSQKTTPEGRSIDERIRKVPPGSYLTFRPGRKPGDRGVLRQHRYYDLGRLPARSVRGRSEESLLDEGQALLDDALRLRLRADVEVGAFLSGGVDSSLVVARAAALCPRPLRTFCLVYDQPIVTAGGDHGAGKDLDRRFARLVAESTGSRHTEVALTPALLQAELPRIARHYGQPNCAVLANWFLSREMGKTLKVALCGDGADELFGSYFLHRVAGALAARGEEALAPLSPSERSFVIASRGRPLSVVLDRFAVFPDAELVHLLRPIGYQRGEILALLRERARLVQHHRDGLRRMLEFDCRNLLVEQVLNYADTLGMAHALEIRSPFLDHRLVAWALGLPAALKVHGGETKLLLKRLALRHLPAELVHRRKEGFVEPAVFWLHRELADFCRAHLLGAGFDPLGLVDRGYAQALVRRFYDPAQGFDFALGKQVWSLLLYALWSLSSRG